MPTRTAVDARDAGLRRVSLLTRGVVAAGVALTGAFSALAAHAFPGRSGAAVSPPQADAVAPPAAETTTAPTTTTAPPPTVVGHRGAAVTAVQRPLQPPVTAPRAVVPARPPVTAAPAPVRHVRPHVVSGGS